MEDCLRKGRALNLDGIANAPIKVTVGFKCEGREKIKLAQEAHESSMTLSEYVEYIISLRHDQANSVAAETTQEVEQRNKTIQQIRQQLAIYEQNEQLQNLFTAHLGKTVKYQDSTGKERNVVINHISDIFKVLVNSFKTN